MKYIDVDDHAKFKYIVKILRLFNVKVDGWTKGNYILNELFVQGIKNQRPYAKIDSRVNLTKFNK